MRPPWSRLAAGPAEESSCPLAERSSQESGDESEIRNNRNKQPNRQHSCPSNVTRSPKPRCPKPRSNNDCCERCRGVGVPFLAMLSAEMATLSFNLLRTCNAAHCLCSHQLLSSLESRVGSAMSCTTDELLIAVLDCCQIGRELILCDSPLEFDSYTRQHRLQAPEISVPRNLVSQADQEENKRICCCQLTPHQTVPAFVAAWPSLLPTR